MLFRSLVPVNFTLGNNQVSELFSNPPDGTTLFRFDSGVNDFQANAYANGEWQRSGEVIKPGEAVFLFNPVDAPIEFLTPINPPSMLISRDIPNGMSCLSSLVTKPGRVSQALDFKLADGDQIMRFDPAKKTYSVSVFAGGAWLPFEPSLGVNEPFFLLRK